MPTRVWASTTNGGNNGNHPLGLMYKIFKDPNSLYGRELTVDYNSSVDVSEDEAIEIISIFGDGRQSNRFLCIADQLFGSTVDFENGLELPIIITGPAKTWASTSYPGNNPRGLVYKVYNSDGSMKKNISNLNDSYGNSTFSVIEGSFTWEQARVDAIQRGGRLAIIHNQAEQEMIESLLINYPPINEFYIGINSSFIWENGENLSFQNWALGEPSSSTGDQYGAITTGGWGPIEFGDWNDLNDPIGYILEIPFN